MSGKFDEPSKGPPGRAVRQLARRLDLRGRTLPDLDRGVACRATRGRGCGAHAPRPPAGRRLRRRAAREEDPEHEPEQADDRRPGVAEQVEGDEVQRPADVSTVVRHDVAVQRRVRCAPAAEPEPVRAEGEQHARHEQVDAGQERSRIGELAACDHQQTDHEREQGEHVGGAADRGARAVLEPAADRPTLPTHVEDAREVQAEGHQREPRHVATLLWLEQRIALLRGTACSGLGLGTTSGRSPLGRGAPARGRGAGTCATGHP